MINRRGLLKGILASSVAPAFISIDNLMKIVVPKPRLYMFTSADLIMPIDEFRFIYPAMNEMARQIDAQIMKEFIIGGVYEAGN